MATTTSEARELVLTHVLIFHRHGDRSPVLTGVGEKDPSKHENDFWVTRLATAEQLATLDRVAKVVGTHRSKPPHAEPSAGGAWPNGQLTQKGIEDMRARGRRLRERYGHLIDDDSRAHEHVYVLSTNVRRTIQSVQCLLHGMFHNDDAQEEKQADGTDVQLERPTSPDALTTKPVFHIHTFERNTIAPLHATRVFGEIELIVAEDVAAMEAAEREQIDRLRDHVRTTLAIPESMPMPWTAVRDTLMCRRAHDLPLPDGITEEMYTQIVEYDAWLWHRLYRRKDFNINVFRQGVEHVFSHLQGVVRQTIHEVYDYEHPPKLSFFSAHDNSIVALLNALQLEIGNKLPEYGTIVAFEIYQDTRSKQHFVKVLFNEETLYFKGHEHDSMCPFAHFEALALDFLGITIDANAAQDAPSNL